MKQAGDFLQIKLIALDLDGTVLQNDHRSVSDRMKAAIAAAADKGIPVVIASGRIDSFLPEEVAAIPQIDWAVTSNGAVLYSMKRKRAVSGAYISPEDAEWILQNIPSGMWAEVWSRGKIHVDAGIWRRSDDYPLLPLHRQALAQIGGEAADLFSFIHDPGTRIEKMNLPLIPVGEREKYRGMLAARGRYSAVNEGAGLEVMKAGVSKARGLRDFCGRVCGVGMENVLAVGDSENDLEMLRECGFGVAMGNASDLVKKAADAVTGTNSEDGAALAIERYAL